VRHGIHLDRVIFVIIALAGSGALAAEDVDPVAAKRAVSMLQRRAVLHVRST
jgi:hypothetical protein